MASISASGPARGRAAWHVPAERAAPGRRGRGHAAGARRRPRRLPPAARRPRTGCAAGSSRSPRRPPSPPRILVKPGRDWAGHVPGQYVRVGVDVDGVRLWRTYSLTHGPRRDRNLSFTVKAIPGGVVSNHLVHRAQAGQMLQLEQAEGEFVLPTPIPRKLLLVTAGSGITPVIGMLRNLFSRRVPVDTDITLVHVNQNESSAIFRDELRAHGTRRPPPAGRAVRRQPRHARRRPPRRAGARPRPSGSPTPAVRPACSTHSRSTTPTAASRSPPSGSARSSSRPARAAPSPSPTAARSRPTAPPRSSTSPKVPAS